MKKLVLFLLFVPVLAFAAEAVAPVATPLPSGVEVPAFDFKILYHIVATGSVLSLLAYISSFIPGVGKYIRLILDFISANLQHK